MFSWTVIATTGEKFSDFAPYVASVNDAGTVAFQAALQGGHRGLHRQWRGGRGGRRAYPAGRCHEPPRSERRAGHELLRGPPGRRPGAGSPGSSTRKAHSRLVAAP
jgi:hypothetical protein